MKSSGSRRDAVRERPSAFISHSSLDLPFARRLADRLQGQGVDVWLDDMQLKAGDALTTAISLALEQHDFVIVILSKASLASDWVRKEMKLATKRASRTPLARLVPVLLERKAAARLPRMLRDTKYVDFSDQKTFEIGLAQLLDLMGRGSTAVGRRSHLERIEFIRSEQLSAALRRNIERILIDYQAYLKRIGFRSRFGAFEIAFERDQGFHLLLRPAIRSHRHQRRVCRRGRLFTPGLHASRAVARREATCGLAPSVIGRWRRSSRALPRTFRAASKGITSLAMERRTSPAGLPRSSI